MSECARACDSRSASVRDGTHRAAGAGQDMYNMATAGRTTPVHHGVLQGSLWNSCSDQCVRS